MSKAKQSEIEIQKANLRKWLKPGDTLHTVLDHVSQSGMSRDIRVVIITKDGEVLHPNYAVSTVLGYPRAKRGDGMRVGGGGMEPSRTHINGASDHDGFLRVLGGWRRSD